MSMYNKRPEVSGGSFLPEDYLRRRGERRAIVISLSLFLIVTMGIVGAFFVTYRQRTVVERRQQEINKEYALENQKIEQLTKLEEQIKEQRDRAEVATALIEKVPRSIMLAELINRSQLHVFGRCGHWTQIEHTARFNRLVGDFFAEGEGA